MEAELAALEGETNEDEFDFTDDGFDDEEEAPEEEDDEDDDDEEEVEEAE